MVAQSLDDFLTPAFIEATAKELDASGFLSDEHEFASYRETMSEHLAKTEQAIRNAG